VSTGEVRSGSGGQAKIAPEPVRPAWHRGAQLHLAMQAEIYQKSLKTVSESFAYQEQAEVILVRHVHEAHAALARIGLSHLNWLSRPENLTAFGGILIGASLGASDIMSAFFDDGPTRKGLTIAWFCTFLTVGAFIYVAGWKRGQLPMPPGYRSAAERAVDAVIAFGRQVAELFKRTRG
jgi:hypothetical protein